MRDEMKRSLGAVTDIEDGGCKSYGPPPGGFTGLFAIRRGDSVVVYVNSCPHIGVPLDWAPNRFLSTDRRHIVCSTHGALFEIDTGVCTAGPCFGDRLEKVECWVEDGEMSVAGDAGL
jgi:nitrite reductase/ring-hydroxylating ferredoxin subunit